MYFHIIDSMKHFQNTKHVPVLFFKTIYHTFADHNNVVYRQIQHQAYMQMPGWSRQARMAESVDALVSNTNVRKDVPVRPRLRVLSKISK